MTPFVFILDATRSHAHLKGICEAVGRQPLASIVVFQKPGASEDLAAVLEPTCARVTAAHEGKADAAIPRALLAEYPGAAVVYAPCEMEPGPMELWFRGLDSRSVTPLLPARRIQSQNSAKLPVAREGGWVAPAAIAEELFACTPNVCEWGLPNLIAALERSGCRVRWNSSRCLTDEQEPGCSRQAPVITMRSRVLAVVPHYGCEAWLDQCLHSLTSQTRPPDNIVVVDDCSPQPPQGIVQRFPEVTLLSAPVPMGPENILYDVMRSLYYDAYLVQDADDWSAVDRLEHSLREAERTGAELVGTQEIRLLTQQREIILQTHPLDVNRAMSQEAGHYLCHGSGLIARCLALRAGGFDRTLRVESDTDFVLRASYLGRIVNLRGFYYYRRIRPHSRTSAESTGHASTLRTQEQEFTLQRARRNAERRKQGVAPEVVMPEGPAPVEFRHILGPPLALRSDWQQ